MCLELIKILSKNTLITLEAVTDTVKENMSMKEIGNKNIYMAKIKLKCMFVFLILNPGVLNLFSLCHVHKMHHTLLIQL